MHQGIIDCFSESIVRLRRTQNRCLPNGGFEVDQYNELLGLTEKGLNTSVIVTIGYRSDEDKTKHLTKVRKPMDLLFESL